MLLTSWLHFGWHAKCYPVAFKHLKIRQTTPCCLLHDTNADCSILHAGWPDWAIFLPVRLLFVGSLKKQPSKMAIPWATNLLYFLLNKLFKSTICILAIVGLAIVLATFQKIGQFFSKSSGHPGCMPYASKFIVMKLPKLPQLLYNYTVFDIRYDSGTVFTILHFLLNLRMLWIS